MPCLIYSSEYHCIHVNGINSRTTSTAEAMYHSMKHKIDGGKAQSAPFKSAEKMMDKAQRKGRYVEILNASEEDVPIVLDY